MIDKLFLLAEVTAAILALILLAYYITNRLDR